MGSPHVRRIHDLFLTDGPERAFVTMEFLNGITLADKVGEAGPFVVARMRDRSRLSCAGPFRAFIKRVSSIAT